MCRCSVSFSWPLLLCSGLLCLGLVLPGVWQIESARAQDDGTAEASAEEVDEDEVNPPTAVKMEETQWPGLVVIFNGHNWGEDKPFLTAIAQCGFAATGCTEAQLEEVGEHGMKGYVYCWAHESATIPQNHIDDENVLCYYYSDRIPPNRWAGEWAVYERQSYAGDPYHPAMMTQTIHWGGHEQFCEIVRGRALEYYHYHWDGDRKPHHYFHFLNVFRQVSLDNANIPICRIVESRWEDPRKTRQTIYTSLAYGVRGFKTGGSGLWDLENRDERGVPRAPSWAKTPTGSIRRLTPTRRFSRRPVVSTCITRLRCRRAHRKRPRVTGCVRAARRF